MAEGDLQALVEALRRHGLSVSLDQRARLGWVIGRATESLAREQAAGGRDPSLGPDGAPSGVPRAPTGETQGEQSAGDGLPLWEASRSLASGVRGWSPSPAGLPPPDLLVDLVAAVVARTPAERARVAQALDTLRPMEPLRWDGPETPPPPIPARRWPWRALLTGLVLGMGGVGWWIRAPGTTPEDTPHQGPATLLVTPLPVEPEAEPPAEPEAEPPAEPPPEPAAEPPPAPSLRQQLRDLLPPGADLLLTGLLLALLALQLRRALHPSPPAPPRPLDRRPPPTLAPPDPFRPVLLDRADQRALVYGIGRLIEPDPSSDLDLVRTVHATARRGGVPQPVLLPLTRPEVVGIWLDTRCPDPALARLATEITTVLAQAGLPVESGHYDPRRDELSDAEGRPLPRSQLDALDLTRLVLISAPSALLRHRRTAAGRAALAVTLRRLAAAPQALVVADPDPDLDDLLAGHHLRRASPADAARAIAGDLGLLRPAAESVGLWAAACCLSPRPVPEGLAWRLAAALDLRPGPQGWPALTGLLPVTGDTLLVDDRARACHLGWAAFDGLPGPLIAARDDLAAWLAELPEDQALPRDRAWLELWRSPAEAALRYLPLLEAGDGLPELRASVAKLVPADLPASETITRLPWSRQDVMDPGTRRVLHELGLGSASGVVLFPELHRVAGRKVAGVGMVATAAVGLMGVGVWRAWPDGPLEECPRDPSWPEEPEPLDSSELGIAVRCAARDPQGWSDPAVWATVPAGTWTIGASEGDDQAELDEKPARSITLPAFEVMRVEVTAGWFRELTPGARMRDAQADDHPARGLDWAAAQAFCAAAGGRLPSEAEWEVATRAGTATRWSFGDEEAGLGDHAWYSSNADHRAHGVALLRPNPWGLYDVHGNVWEWTASCYTAVYAVGADVDTTKVDPTLLTSTGEDCLRALRGGAFWVEPWFLRSSSRAGDRPSLRNELIGFRCVRGVARQLDP